MKIRKKIKNVKKKRTIKPSLKTEVISYQNLTEKNLKRIREIDDKFSKEVNELNLREFYDTREYLEGLKTKGQTPIMIFLSKKNKDIAFLDGRMDKEKNMVLAFSYTDPKYRERGIRTKLGKKMYFVFKSLGGKSIFPGSFSVNKNAGKKLGKLAWERQKQQQIGWENAWKKLNNSQKLNIINSLRGKISNKLLDEREKILRGSK